MIRSASNTISRRPLPEDAKLIGVFGFLSRYKGFETAIRAMRHLPSDHHLLIFCGVHLVATD
jgi:glycosyltransferase involved in cell wall biosynthesis